MFFTLNLQCLLWQHILKLEQYTKSLKGQGKKVYKFLIYSYSEMMNHLCRIFQEGLQLWFMIHSWLYHGRTDQRGTVGIWERFILDIFKSCVLLLLPYTYSYKKQTEETVMEPAGPKFGSAKIWEYFSQIWCGFRKLAYHCLKCYSRNFCGER